MRCSYHIDAPVSTVFDFFVDPRKLADLLPPAEILELKRTMEGTGTFTRYRTKIAGVPFESFSVYTDVVANQYISETSSSSMVGTWDYTFEPEGTGTKLTMEHHSRALWDLPPLRTLGDLVAARMNESFMRRAKARIERPRN